MKFRPLPRYRDCAVVEQVEYEKTKGGIIIPEAYRKSTFPLSLHPRSEDLLRLDMGGTAANLGVIVRPPDDSEDGLRAGDAVLYDQYSAPVGFSLHHAYALKKYFKTAGFCYLIPKAAIGGHLSELPDAARFL